ncbi:RNase A-like domain-containing protein [Enterobacter sichuanensis]
MRTRLTNRPTLSGSSTFYNRPIAEDAISRALKFNASYIRNWAKTARSGSKLNIDFFAGKEIGFGIESATGPIIKSHKVRVVLELQFYNNKPYYVLTAFPVLR